MNYTQPLMVVKRDGSREPFSVAKLRSCFANVLRVAGYEAYPSEALAKAVAEHIGQWRGLRPPSSDYVFRCVRSVLEQCGLPDVANEITLHRRLREGKRRRIRVTHVTSEDNTSPWRKAEVIADAKRRFGLTASAARFIAGQVESQVFGLKYRWISKGLISELVRNEVLAWGLGESVMENAPAAEL